MKTTFTERPKILLAAPDGTLLLALNTLLADTRAHIDITHSSEGLAHLATTGAYQLIITTFVWPLLGPHSLAAKSRHGHRATDFIALLDRQTSPEAEVELTLALLRSDVAQVMSLPVSGRRLHRKVTALLEKHPSPLFSLAQKLSY